MTASFYRLLRFFNIADGAVRMFPCRLSARLNRMARLSNGREASDTKLRPASGHVPGKSSVIITRKISITRVGESVCRKKVSQSDSNGEGKGVAVMNCFIVIRNLSRLRVADFRPDSFTSNLKIKI